MGPWTLGVGFSLFLCFKLMTADTRKELGLTIEDTQTFEKFSVSLHFVAVRLFMLAAIVICS